MNDYPFNAWYVAAMHDEVLAGSLLARTYLGEPVVLFRDANGVPHALLDRCPHRFAPLSKGQLIDGGNELQCGYHGLQFGVDGRCSHNPHGPIPKAAATRAFPTRERAGLIWIWMGVPELADDSRIPDYGDVTTAPEDATIRGYLPTKCDAMLLVDNILDLSHVDYLHTGSLGGGGLHHVKPVVDEPADNQVRIAWLSTGENAPPSLDMHLRTPGSPTDQWTIVTWTAPSTMLLSAGATLVGERREEGVATLNLHLATPERPGFTHYWYWSTRNVAVNPQANAMIRGIIENAFSNEDKPMLEAQQRNMGSATLWELKPVLLSHDSGAVRCRRKLEAQCRTEQA